MSKIRGTDGKLYTKEEAERVIPKGDYCYAITGWHDDPVAPRPVCKSCPFHTYRKGKGEQNDGYCRYLKHGDWMVKRGIGLLWDGVKECGINDEFEMPEDDEHTAK